MNRKEKLEQLIDEGKRILHFNSHNNEHDYLVWKEKVETIIGREYGKDSIEYEKIKNISSKLQAISYNLNNGFSIEKQNDVISRILIKLEAWASVEE